MSYATWAEASRAARYLRHQVDTVAEPFRCRACGKFHTGKVSWSDEHWQHRRKERPRRKVRV